MKDQGKPANGEYVYPSFWAAVARKFGAFFRKYRRICYYLMAIYFIIAFFGWAHDSTVSSKWSETGKKATYTRTLRSWNSTNSIVVVGGEVYQIDRIVNESLLNTQVTFYQKDLVYESGDTAKKVYLCFDNSGNSCAEVQD